MEVYIERENETKKISLEQPITMKALVKQLGISLDSIILIKNSEICLEDEEVTDKDSVKLLSVVSGG